MKLSIERRFDLKGATINDEELNVTSTCKSSILSSSQFNSAHMVTIVWGHAMGEFVSSIIPKYATKRHGNTLRPIVVSQPLPHTLTLGIPAIQEVTDDEMAMLPSRAVVKDTCLILFPFAKTDSSNCTRYQLILPLHEPHGVDVQIAHKLTIFRNFILSFQEKQRCSFILDMCTSTKGGWSLKSARAVLHKAADLLNSHLPVTLLLHHPKMSQPSHLQSVKFIACQAHDDDPSPLMCTACLSQLWPEEMISHNFCVNPSCPTRSWSLDSDWGSNLEVGVAAATGQGTDRNVGTMSATFDRKTDEKVHEKAQAIRLTKTIVAAPLERPAPLRRPNEASRPPVEDFTPAFRPQGARKLPNSAKTPTYAAVGAQSTLTQATLTSALNEVQMQSLGQVSSNSNRGQAANWNNLDQETQTGSSIDSLVGDLTNRLEGLDQRMTNLEKFPPLDTKEQWTLTQRSWEGLNKKFLTLQKQLDNAMTQLDRTTQTCLKNQLANEKSFARMQEKIDPPQPIITVGEETNTDEQQTPASPLVPDALSSRPSSPTTNGQTNDNGAN